MDRHKHKKTRGAVLPALIFVIFALIFALFCACGKTLLIRLAGGGAAEASANGAGGARGKIIVLDPGHGGEDGGAPALNGMSEKEINLALSRDLALLLRAAGYTVIETRTDDRLLYDPQSDYVGRKKVQDLAARLKIAEDSGCSLFVSIHQNSFPERQYSGLQVYYSPNCPESAAWAERIRATVVAHLQPENTRAAKAAGKNIFLLDRLSCPAVLVECGFLSNPEECAALCSEEYRASLALTLYCAIASGN